MPLKKHLEAIDKLSTRVIKYLSLQENQADAAAWVDREITELDNVGSIETIDRLDNAITNAASIDDRVASATAKVEKGMAEIYSLKADRKLCYMASLASFLFIFCLGAKVSY